MPSTDIWHELDDITTHEVMADIHKLNLGTASGQSEIGPELILYGGSALRLS